MGGEERAMEVRRHIHRVQIDAIIWFDLVTTWYGSCEHVCLEIADLDQLCMVDEAGHKR